MNQQHMQNTQNGAKNYMGAGGNPQAQPHMMPDTMGAAAGGDNLQNDLLLQQLQQIQQYVVQTQPDLLGSKSGAPGASSAPGAHGNPESGANPTASATPQNILAALADIQKQQPIGAGNFAQDGDGFGAGGKSSAQNQDEPASGQPPQSSSHGQHALSQLTQQQIVDQKSVQNLDLNQQSSGSLNPMFYQILQQQQQLQGLNNFNGGAGGASSSMNQGMPSSSNVGGNANFDLLNLQQMQMMGGLPQNNFPMMTPFMPPLQHQFSGGMGGGSGMSGGNQSGGGGHGSAASFHQPTEKNQVKLFVGGLAFSTSEQHLQNYFQKFGKVENTIVMREKMTQRGRGFGFVLLSFNDEDEAGQVKRSIIGQNKTEGHHILDKRVDVKSADDHQGRGEGGHMGGGGGGGQGNSHHGGGHGGHQGGNNHFMMTNSGQHIQKPNPYVQVVQKDGVTGSEDPKDSVKFTYPKSKIFVGGLDFKLTSEELKEHFMKFGEVHDAIILKDIYTGSSRGFGFVTFTNESVAQDLIKNNPVTEINGRRVDIKKAEPKDKSSGGGGGGGNGGGGRAPFPPGPGGGGRGGGSFGGHGGGNGGPMGGHNQMGGNQPAVIPPYGQQMSGGRDGERGGRGGHGHRGGMRGDHGGHHQRYGNNRGNSEDKIGGDNDGMNSGYHGGGGRGDFHRQGSGGWNNRNNYEDRDNNRGFGGGRGGYDRNSRGGHGDRGGYQKRDQYQNRGHQGGHQQQNNNGGGGGPGGPGGNNPRAGSSSSHESGQDSSYQISFERANNAIRKRQEQDNGQHQQGRPHGGGHRRNDNYGGHGGNAGGNRGQSTGGQHQDKGFYSQQPQQQQQQQQASGQQMQGNNDGGMNKPAGGGDMQRRRYRSRSRE